MKKALSLILVLVILACTTLASCDLVDATTNHPSAEISNSSLSQHIGDPPSSGKTIGDKPPTKPAILNGIDLSSIINYNYVSEHFSLSTEPAKKIVLSVIQPYLENGLPFEFPVDFLDYSNPEYFAYYIFNNISKYSFPITEYKIQSDSLVVIPSESVDHLLNKVFGFSDNEISQIGDALAKDENENYTVSIDNLSGRGGISKYIIKDIQVVENDLMIIILDYFPNPYNSNLELVPPSEAYTLSEHCTITFEAKQYNDIVAYQKVYINK